MKKIIMLYPQDLRRGNESLNPKDITLYNFRSSVLTKQDINEAHEIVFIDKDNQIKILKSV